MAKDKFQEVLAKFPLGVSVATLGRGGVESALTISWMSPVSFEPPHVMIAVDKLHLSVDFLKSTKNFVLNLLKADQAKLAGVFAKQSVQGENKLAGVKTREAPSGAPILTDALAYLDCEVAQTLEVGDHLLFIGKVTECDVLNDAEPLTTLGGPRYTKTKKR